METSSKSLAWFPVCEAKRLKIGLIMKILKFVQTSKWGNERTKTHIIFMHYLRKLQPQLQN